MTSYSCNNNNNTVPKRPVLRYHGGKWRLARFILQHIPKHTCYVEPFGGAASVLLRKEPSFVEVYNDLNGEVVNFFKVLRERTEELFTAINLTPYSRAEFLLAQEPSTDDLERARRFYVWSWQGRGRAGVKKPGGWRFHYRLTRKQTSVHDWTDNHHLWVVAKRLKDIHIESGDALTIIRRYDDPGTVFYVDPPYVQQRRGTRWRNAAYLHEYTDEQHRYLSDVLHTIRGKARFLNTEKKKSRKDIKYAKKDDYNHRFHKKGYIMTPEETLQTYLQNKIAKDLFGITIALPSTDSLTIADVEKAYSEINKLRKIYYCVSSNIPTKDEQGEGIYYFIDDTVFLHQDNLNEFITHLERAGYLAQDVKKLFREDQIQRIGNSLDKEMNTCSRISALKTHQ